jgi:hypothetical protein
MGKERFTISCLSERQFSGRATQVAAENKSQGTPRCLESLSIRSELETSGPLVLFGRKQGTNRG